MGKDPAAADDAAGDKDDLTTEDEGGDKFDEARAMSTIKAQREAEAAAKAQVKELEAKLAGYTKAELDAAEAEKAAEVKLAERDATLAGKDAEIAALHVQHDFVARALAMGVADPALAYLAAKEQGLLGTYDPKEGTVGEHGFEALGEKYPSFKVDGADDGSGSHDSGDAGARKRGKATSTSSQFNTAVRSAIGQ